MNLLSRLALLERQQPSIDPFAVLVMVLDDGTTVSVCYPLPAARTDHFTLGDYRARYGETYQHLEKWIIAGDAAPIEDRMAATWWES